MRMISFRMVMAPLVIARLVIARLVMVLFVMALLATACTSDAQTTTGTVAAPNPAPTAAPGITEEPSVAPAVSNPTAIPEPTGTPSPTNTPAPADTNAREDEGAPGSVGLDDSLFPTYGNGGYDVQRYHITLNFDPATREIDADTVVTLIPTQALSQFNLELVGYDITDILVDGQQAKWSRAGGADPELVITPSQALESGVPVDVTVFYNGKPTGISGPVFPSNGWTDFGDVIIVAGEPEGAAGWFPVNDHPLDKALYNMTITAPLDFEVASNGELTSRFETDTDATWNFAMDQPQASYLTTLMIGENLRLVDADPSQSGIAIRHAFEESIADRAEAAMRPTADMIDYFSDLFGDYPFSNYGTAVVDEPLGFALETQTLSVFGSDALGEHIVAHELAHQWFGNDVSLADWSDLWLNEGFANYAEYLWAEQSIPEYSIDDEVDALIRAAAPLLQDPPGAPSTGDLFSASVYFRGGLTLHALRKTIDDDAFFTTLQTYVSEFGGGNARTADFIEVAERISGQDLDAFFDAWLYQEGLPVMPG